MKKINVLLSRREIEKALFATINCTQNDRLSFFEEFRRKLKVEVEKAFNSYGIETTNLTVSSTKYLKSGKLREVEPLYITSKSKTEVVFNSEFCATYGHSIYSLKALNYLNQEYTLFPSLEELFKLISIGNILVSVENSEIDVNVEFDNVFNCVGYVCDISKMKKKSYICLLGISINKPFLRKFIDNYLSIYDSQRKDLDELFLKFYQYPILYVNRITGELYTCTCFRNKFSISEIMHNILESNKSHLYDKLWNIGLLDNLCHYCSGGVPKYKYASDYYFSTFAQYYFPYMLLLSRLRSSDSLLFNKELRKEIENDLRKHFSYPQIGENWLNETRLFYIVKDLYPNIDVIHHYRGKELRGLEIDIWFPQNKIAIEYQGEQHFKVVKHWGGKSGLVKRQENDERKRQICERLGYSLVYFFYNETISSELVSNRLNALF